MFEELKEDLKEKFNIGNKAFYRIPVAILLILIPFISSYTIAILFDVYPGEWSAVMNLTVFFLFVFTIFMFIVSACMVACICEKKEEQDYYLDRE